MTENNAPAPPDPSHDDLSNPGPVGNEGVPEFDNDSHDRNDDGPDRAPGSGNRRAPEETITGKPISDMDPPGQEEAIGVD